MARQPTAAQEARVKFMAKLVELHARRTVEPPHVRGAQMAKEEELESGHTQALANAVAVGPERTTVEQRRFMLARLLAQRTAREAEGPRKWTSLAERVVQQVEALDEDARLIIQMAEIDPAVLNPTTVAMEEVERFLHALDRAVSAQEVQGQEEEETKDRDTGTEEADAEGGDNDHG